MKGFMAVVVTFIVIGVLMIVEGAPPPPSTEKSTTTSIQKIPSLAQTKPKKPLQIKLKRNSKDDYSWEISGENVQDIINADRKLRKELGFE